MKKVCKESTSTPGQEVCACGGESLLLFVCPAQHALASLCCLAPVCLRSGSGNLCPAWHVTARHAALLYCSGL